MPPRRQNKARINRITKGRTQAEKQADQEARQSTLPNLNQLQASAKSMKKTQQALVQKPVAVNIQTPVLKPKMSPPLAKTGFTISSGKSGFGATISSGSNNKANLYKDPNTGSTIATKQARTNIAQGKDYNIIASTASKTLLGKGVPTPTEKERPGLLGTSLTGMRFDAKAPSISAGDLIGQKPKTPVTPVSQTGITQFRVDPMEEKQKGILSSLSNSTQTKTDLLPNVPKIPTLLTDLARKRRAKQLKSGGGFWDTMLRSLLQ